MKKLSVILWSLLFAAGLYAQDIDVLLGSMSRKEKIAQIIIVAIDSQDTLHHTQQAELAEKGLGGLIVMDDNLSDNMQLVNELQAHSRIPMIVTIDGEWGASMRYREFAQFPRAMQLGALTDDDFIYAVGQKIGEELRELKIFANFAPVVDINNNPDNPVINTRSFGEDREKVAKFGVQYMKGMRDAGVAGSAKHFPGHGDTDVDSHKGLPVLAFDRARDKRRIMLGPHYGLDATKRLFQRSRLPFAFGKVLVGGWQIRGLVHVALHKLFVAQGYSQLVLDAPMNETDEIRTKLPLGAIVLECRHHSRKVGENDLHDVIRILFLQPLRTRDGKDKTGIKIEEPSPRGLISRVRDRLQYA